MSLYYDSNRIVRFYQDIMFSSIRHEEDEILEPCSKMERDNTDTLDGLYALYFHLHLHAIHELGVSIPFTPLKRISR